MARRWIKNLAVASYLAFSIYLGFGLILPLFPLYVKELGGGGLEIGLLMAAFMFTRAFLARPFGRLSDRIGRKKVIVTGMFLYAVLAYLFTLPSDWYGLILVRVMQGTASAMVWPIGEALVIDSSPPSRRSRSISTFILISNIGIVAGPLISGLILFISHDVLGLGLLESYRTPFYFTSFLALTGAVLGLIMLKDVLPPIKDRARMRDVERTTMKKMRLWIKRSLWFLYANSFMEGLSFSMISVIMVLFMERNFGLGARDYSILFGIAMGLGLLVLVPTGKLADKYRRKPFIVHGSLSSRVSTVIMSLSPLLPLGMLVALVTYVMREMGRQMAMAATRALQADLAPEKVRGKLIGTIQAFSNIGAVVGPISGGIIWDLTSEREYDLLSFTLPGDSIPFLLSAFFGIVAALLVLRYVSEPGKKGGKTYRFG